jgi:hypothetical protein
MASELRVNTLKDASGNNSVAVSTVFNGSAKVYAERTAAATPATISSFNVASMTDTGTGDTGYNLTSALDDANGPVAGTNSSTSGDRGILGKYTTASQMRSLTRNSSDADTDRAVSVIGYGDLA